jgi:hypothetical protein
MTDWSVHEIGNNGGCEPRWLGTDSRNRADRRAAPAQTLAAWPEGGVSTEQKKAIDDFPSAGKITMGHLLSHTSGIPYTNDQPWGGGSVSFTIDEIVERLVALPLDFEPEPNAITRPGGGSFYSTAKDLLQFARAVFREDFVSAELRRDVLGVDEKGYLSQGRSPGFVAKLHYDPERDIIVISLSNSYAVPADWAVTLADLAVDKDAKSSWLSFRQAAMTVESDDPRLIRTIRRNWEDNQNGSSIRISCPGSTVTKALSRWCASNCYGLNRERFGGSSPKNMASSLTSIRAFRIPAGVNNTLTGSIRWHGSARLRSAAALFHSEAFHRCHPNSAIERDLDLHFVASR